MPSFAARSSAFFRVLALFLSQQVGRGWLQAHNVLGAAATGVLRFARVLADGAPPSPNAVVVPAHRPSPTRSTVTTWALSLAPGSGGMVSQESSVTADELWVSGIAADSIVVFLTRCPW